MPLVNVTCKKCGESSKIDIGDYTRKDVEKWLKDSDGGFHCFGNHVELGARSDYWVVDWDSLTEGHAPTEEEFVASLKEKFKEVYDTQELQEKYEVVGFSYGMCIAINKKNNKENVFDFKNSPKGKRYYYA